MNLIVFVYMHVFVCLVCACACVRRCEYMVRAGWVHVCAGTYRGHRASAVILRSCSFYFLRQGFSQDLGLASTNTLLTSSFLYFTHLNFILTYEERWSIDLLFPQGAGSFPNFTTGRNYLPLSGSKCHLYHHVCQVMH